jgi:hypothetical protein
LLNDKNRLLFFVRSKKEKQKKQLHNALAHNFRVRFFFDNQWQRRSLAKRNLSRAAFKEKASKTHPTI